MSDLVHMSPATLSKGRLWAALVVILFGQFIVSIDLTVLPERSSSFSARQRR